MILILINIERIAASADPINPIRLKETALMEAMYIDLISIQNIAI